ncbi:uncharacterized protein Gasu_03560 [Galdieria sulphuraria]|uniref:Uncharacterized protein n=1 Tax=Galdieria sulphuraria TaxID=130081 RepID=M2W9K8_GALSU|nr:uncharacterized protein Gasu_03560 [Galdieria sulphuraria]EME32586.1 hypothetical protein Gasu_03560 [Galdieria sulphuraria]|eukprot:XP_005709106.1 hypothetical protein Gasu_03560 [Galdieria sulphuraria]
MNSDKRDKDIYESEQIVYHSSPPMSLSSSLHKESKDEKQVDVSSSDDDDSEPLECFSSIYPFQEEKDNHLGEEAYFWSKLKESGAILEQLMQFQQPLVDSVPTDVEEETQSNASYEDYSYDGDSFEESKPFFVSLHHHHLVGEFQLGDSQDPIWTKLLQLLHPKSTFPTGCLKLVIDNNLLSASVIRNCFQLLCCPLCNPNIASEVDLSKLCQCLLYLFDRRISLTVGEKESPSSMTWKGMPEWIPSFQDFERFMSHMVTITNTKQTNDSVKEKIPKPTCFILSIWKRVLSCIAACIPLITYSPYGGRFEEMDNIIQVMTRILLDPFGKTISQVCWILYRCWIVLGGGCKQLTCLVNEYFVSIFLKHATSIALQLRLLSSLDSSLQELSQYFAYKLFILYTQGEQNGFYSIAEKIKHQVGNFLLSFLKENLVYGADIQLVESDGVSGQFQKFVYPLIFEMKEFSSRAVYRVDMLNSQWQFCENTWSEHEISSFHIRDVEPQTLVKYHFKESFEPREFVGLMEDLCQHSRNCESISIIIRFALLAIQPSLLFQMESHLRERLGYAISILKSTSAGFINMNSCKMAIYLGHLHMIAECLCHSMETSHSGVIREEQLTLRHWVTGEDA